jgi:acetolactate synthase-1/3 small subunit
MAVTDIFHGHIVDVTRDSMIIEMTGKREKLNAFIDVLDDYEILEVSSSGMIGLERGAETARKPGVNCRLKE